MIRRSTCSISRWRWRSKVSFGRSSGAAVTASSSSASEARIMRGFSTTASPAASSADVASHAPFSPLMESIHKPPMTAPSSSSSSTPDLDAVSLAPMMSVTHTPFLLLCRLISNTTVLYSEMMTANSVVQNARVRRRFASPAPMLHSLWHAPSSAQSMNPPAHGTSMPSPIPSLSSPSSLSFSSFPSSPSSSPSPSPSPSPSSSTGSPYRFASSPASAEIGARFSPENMLVAQLGGDNADVVIEAMDILASLGWRRFNLNVGCPSQSVANEGHFGAALMKHPDLVATISERATARAKSWGGDFTIKCRIGVDDFDSYEFLHDFIERVSKEGKIHHFILHARKALLQGLSPRENRTVPPLLYDRVYKIASNFSHLKFTINGGVQTMEEIKGHLAHGMSGVMIGRKAKDDPWIFSAVDTDIHKTPTHPPSKMDVLRQYIDLIKMHAEGPDALEINYPMITAPALSLFHGCPGEKLFRKSVAERHITSIGAWEASILAATAHLTDHLRLTATGQPRRVSSMLSSSKLRA